MPEHDAVTKAHLIVLGSIAGLFVWIFADALFGAGTFAFRDAGHYYYPLLQFVRSEWLEAKGGMFGVDACDAVDRRFREGRCGVLDEEVVEDVRRQQSADRPFVADLCARVLVEWPRRVQDEAAVGQPQHRRARAKLEPTRHLEVVIDHPQSRRELT